jgi:outer membrane protein TolC
MSYSIPSFMKTVKQETVHILVRYSCVCLFSFLYAPDNIAQIQASESAAAFTESQIVQLALKYNPSVQSLNTRVKIAEYQLKSSGRIRNPELRISDVSTRYYTNEFDKLRTGLRWRMPQPGELGEEKQQAKVEYWERQVNAIRHRQDFIASIRKDFADVIMYDRLAELEQERLVKEAERMKIIETLFNVGSRTVVQFFKAKMQHMNSQNDLNRTLQNQQMARRKLASLTHIQESSPLVANDIPEITEELSALITLAVKSRPEIELEKQRSELAGKKKKAEYMKLIPWPRFIEISYHMEKNRARDWGEFMTGINLPLFNWNRGNIKASNLIMETRAREYKAAIESIENEVRSAYLNYRDQFIEMKNFQSSARQLISYADTITQEAHQHGTLMADEILEIELTVIDTKKLLAEKSRNLSCSLADLYDALGIEENTEILFQDL